MGTVEQHQERPEAAARIRRDRGKTLSILWVFAMVNYIYCDVLALMDHDYLRQVLTGSVGGVDMTRGFLLAASVLMEIPMAMIVLSWVLRPGPNRIANLVAGSVMTVVQLGTLFAGNAPTPSYLFFSAVEIGTTAFIVWYAWTWPKAGHSHLTAGSGTGAGAGHRPWADSPSTRSVVPSRDGAHRGGLKSSVRGRSVRPGL